MAFVFIGYSASGLSLQSDDGHLFLFEIVPNGRTRAVRLGDTQWKSGRPPLDGALVIEHAHQFATLCAKDFGLA